MGNIYTVRENEALIVSGGCFRRQKIRVVVEGWFWACNCVNDVRSISLEIMTLNPICDQVETAEDRTVTINGVAQVKLMKDDHKLLETACTQFLGKGHKDIENLLLQALEGHLRSILRTMTLDDIYKEQNMFALLIREVAAADAVMVGIDIVSFTMMKLTIDDDSDLDSLRESQIPVVEDEEDDESSPTKLLENC